MIRGAKVFPCAVVLLLMTAGATARTASNAPHEFAYRITGSAKVRPILVFNDGSDTYVQPNPDAPSDAMIRGAEAESQGPYLVIRGIVAEFRVVTKKDGAATVYYEGGTKESVKPTQITAPTPAGAAKVVETTAPAVRVDTPAQVVDKDARVRTSSVVVESERASTPSTPINSTPSVIDNCKPKLDTKENAFVVSFARKATALSSVGLERLKEAIGNTADIQVLRAFVEDSDNNDKVLIGRGKAIREAFRKIGVDDSKVVISTRPFTGIGTEIRVEHGKLIECDIPYGQMEIIAARPDNASIAANDDVLKILEKIATAMNKKLRVEGKTRTLPVRLVAKNISLVLMLEKIGESVGKDADVILREGEIVIRFITNE